MDFATIFRLEENLNLDIFSEYQKIFDLGERSDPSLQLYQATHEWLTSGLVEKDWNSDKKIIRLPTLRKEIIYNNGLLKQSYNESNHGNNDNYDISDELEINGSEYMGKSYKYE